MPEGCLGVLPSIFRQKSLKRVTIVDDLNLPPLGSENGLMQHPSRHPIHTKAKPLQFQVTESTT